MVRPLAGSILFLIVFLSGGDDFIRFALGMIGTVFALAIQYPSLIFDLFSITRVGLFDRRPGSA